MKLDNESIIYAKAFSISEILLVKLEPMEFCDISEDRFYYVPSYQRNYNWISTEHIKKLIDDLVEFWWITKKLGLENKKSYFIGNFVLKKTKDSKSNKYNIIDGQQRLTTFFIMVCVIYQKIKEKNQNSRLLSELREMILNKNNQNSVLRIDNKSAREYLSEIQTNSFNLPIFNNLENKEEKNNYFSNYVYLYKNMFDNKYKFDQYEWFEIIKHVKVSMIMLGDYDDEISVFESINSTGLKLNIAELMKSYLYLISEKLDINDALINRIQKIFDKKIYNTFTKIKNDGRVWDEKQLNRFIAAYIQIKTEGKDPTKETSILYKEFKEIVNEKFGIFFLDSSIRNENKADFFNSLNLFLNDFEFLIDKYNEYVNISKSFNYNDQSLKFIIDSKFELYLPILLTIRLNERDNSNEIDSREIQKIFELLDLHNITISITNTRNSDNRFLAKYLFNEKFNVRYETLKKYLTKDSTNNSILKNYEDFIFDFERADFYKTHKKIGMYILARIENHLNEDSHEFLQSINDWTIEHIMPQNNEKWEQETYDNVANFQRKVHTLGNLTLIKSNLNSKMSNDPWKKKEVFLRDSNLKINKKIIEIAKSEPNGWNIFNDNNNSSDKKWINYIIEEMNLIWNMQLLKDIKPFSEKNDDHWKIILNDIENQGEQLKLTATKLLEYSFFMEKNKEMNCKEVTEISVKIFKKFRDHFGEKFVKMTNLTLEKFENKNYMSERIGSHTLNSKHKRAAKNSLFIKNESDKRWKLLDEVYNKYLILK